MRSTGTQLSLTGTHLNYFLELGDILTFKVTYIGIF